MARGLNKVVLVGTVVGTPQLREFPNGDAIVDVRIVTRTYFRDRRDLERKQHDEFHDLHFKGNLARQFARQVSLGCVIWVEGGNHRRIWHETGGAAKEIVEIRVIDYELMATPEAAERAEAASAVGREA